MYNRYMRSPFFNIIFIGLVIGSACISCGQNDSHKQDWAEGSTLRIGTDATYPPFEIVDTESGQPVGFDIDIIKAVCEVNGWTPEFIVTPFDGIISGLKGGKYDCIISAMTITPERAAMVAFSEPYYLAGQVVAVPVSDTVINSSADLVRRRVGVQLGTTGERMAKAMQGVTVFSYDNIGAAFIDMENGHLDAVLNDYPTTMEYIKRRALAKTVGELLSEEHYGIAVRKDNHKLLEYINKAIEQLKSSGRYEEINSRWFSVAENIADSL